jgi:hypothetical protein
MPLDRLPDELKIQVFSQLQVLKRADYDQLNETVWQWDPPNSLSNAALCCRSWNELATPILYSTFVDIQSHTTKFLRTILERPDLAFYVKTYSSDFPCIDAIEPDLIDSHRAKIEKIMETVCTDERLRNNWYRSMFRTGEYWHDGDAIAALLILLLPNVSTLELPIELPLGVYMALLFLQCGPTTAFWKISTVLQPSAHRSLQI